LSANENRSRGARTPELAAFWAILVLGTAADQLSKIAAWRYLAGREGPYVVIPGVLEFTLRTNRGGPFSLLSDRPMLLTAFSVVALILIVGFVHLGRGITRWQVAALGLVGAGAVGNLVDRFFFGEVRDFVDLVCIKWPIDWAVFNLADVFITVGAAILVVAVLFQRERPAAAPQGRRS
jgi:signal peptidase II